MTLFNTTNFLSYSSTTGSETPPATVDLTTLSSSVDDTNSDGNIDSVDTFWQGYILYSGTTATINGNDYAIFQYGNSYYIPFDSSFDDISSFTNPAAWTFNAVPENANVVNCFLTGTLIATPIGEIAVEDLKIGDQITTAGGRAVDVRWIARQTYHQFANKPIPEKHAPVCISAGALGDGLPHSDLYLTADHGMILDGLVVNAGALVNDDTIRFVDVAEMPSEFTYYHIETEHHDQILANGAPSETFIDMAGRAGFDNYQEYLDLYGVERMIPERDNLRITTQRLLPQDLRERLGIASFYPQMAGTETLFASTAA